MDQQPQTEIMESDHMLGAVPAVQRQHQPSEPVDIGQPMETREPLGGRIEDSEQSDDEPSSWEFSGGIRKTLWPPWKPLPAAGILTLVLLSLVTAFAIVRLRASEWEGSPEARKGAAVVVISLSEPSFGGSTWRSSFNLPGMVGQGDQAGDRKSLVLWSGKCPHSNSTVKDDLWTFEMHRRVWRRHYSFSLRENYTGERPRPRWKQGSVRRSNNSMLVFGGDAMGVWRDGQLLTHMYLNDMWLLKAENGSLGWQSLEDPLPVRESMNVSSNDFPASKCGIPDKRRAMVAVLLPISTATHSEPKEELFIHGGRTRMRGLDTDAWTFDLASRTPCWSRLWPSEKKGKSVRPQPSSRKGHVAVNIPGDRYPLVWIFGGRNDVKEGNPYKSDVWVFDPRRTDWEDWTPWFGPAPVARDHLGAWYYNGSVYIFGGRGGTDYYTSKPLNDMWAFDLSTRTWSQIFTNSKNRPSPRFLFGMDTYAHDVHLPVGRGVRVIRRFMSDEEENTKLFDTDAGAGQLLLSIGASTVSSGEGRGPLAMEGEMQDLRVVFFGGESVDGCYLNDLYELEMLSMRWNVLSPLTGSRYQRCHVA
eukprot:jgi/Botrbrau1/19051/Bobra.0100s0075.1